MCELPLDPQKLEFGEGRRRPRPFRVPVRPAAPMLLGYADGDRVGDRRTQHRRPAHPRRGTGRIGVHDVPTTTVPVPGTPTVHTLTGAIDTGTGVLTGTADVGTRVNTARAGAVHGHAHRSPTMPGPMRHTRRQPMHREQPRQHPEHTDRTPQSSGGTASLGSGHGPILGTSCAQPRDRPHRPAPPSHPAVHPPPTHTPKAPAVTREGLPKCGRGRFRTADILLVRQALYP